VEGGGKDSVPIGPEEDWQLLCPGGDWHNAEVEILEEPVLAMVQKGQTLGFLYAWDSEGKEVAVSLVALEEVNSNLAAFFSKYGLILMIVLIALAVIVYLYIRKHQKDTIMDQSRRLKKSLQKEEKQRIRKQERKERTKK